MPFSSRRYCFADTSDSDWQMDTSTGSNIFMIIIDVMGCYRGTNNILYKGAYVYCQITQSDTAQILNIA